jgi:hypothetical protein
VIAVVERYPGMPVLVLNYWVLLIISNKRAKRCTCGKFSMAYRGSALGSLAQIKERIMLNGGVLTSIAMAIGPGKAFRVYDGRANRGMYDPRDIADNEPVELHALFCYG